MRVLSITIACLLALIHPAAATGSLDRPAPVPRLRPQNAEAARLIDEGLQRSPTFRRLVARLEHSDVIVYVRLRPDMSESLGGSLRFLARSATDRFLLVSLNRRNSPAMQVAFLGHELQHVAEVADSPDVTGQDELRQLYRRIGVRVRPDAFDSRAAQLAGQAVRLELRDQPDNVRLARHVAWDDVERDTRRLAGASIDSPE
jgi:hypothetical protein